MAMAALKYLQVMTWLQSAMPFGVAVFQSGARKKIILVS